MPLESPAVARIPPAYRRAGLLVAAAGASIPLSLLVRLSIDARYSLAWGAEIAGGDLPDAGSPLQSTPHPLPILVGVVLSPLGPRGAADAWAILAAAGWLLLLYAAWRLARALAAAPGGRVVAAGVVAVALVATRERLGFFALNAFVDVPFAALCVLAAAILAERGREGVRAALALLAVAGLLRPEAWGLAVAVAVWAARGRGEGRAALFGLAVLGPAVWIGQDLLLAGDPLHSLTHTQEGADRLGRETGVLDAPVELVGGLARLVGVPLALGGAVVLALRTRPWAAATALAISFGLVFLGLGALDLPLNDRYLVPVVVVFAAVVGARATDAEIGVGKVVAIAAVVGSVALLPWDVPDLVDRAERAVDRRGEDAQLEQLVEDQRSAIDRCSRITTLFEDRALVAHLVERDPADVIPATVTAPAPDDAAVFARFRGNWDLLAIC